MPHCTCIAASRGNRPTTRRLVAQGLQTRWTQRYRTGGGGHPQHPHAFVPLTYPVSENGTCSPMASAATRSMANSASTAFTG